MKKVIVFFCVLFIAMPSLLAGPFGVEMGWTLEDLEKNGLAPKFDYKEYNVSTYGISPTNPHPDLSLYFVEIDDLKGVYQIFAVSRDVSTSRYGAEIKNLYEKVKGQISLTYGTPEETDYLLPGSIWDEPRYWMMAMKLRERLLISKWDCKGKDGIDSIGLVIFVNSTSSAGLVLGYESVNKTEVEQRQEASSSSVF